MALGGGVAVFDANQDGWPDLSLVIGTDHLWRNEGNGTFADVSAEAGVAGAANDWSTGAWSSNGPPANVRK